MQFFDIFIQPVLNSLNWTWNSITFQVPWYTNFFWGLILISLVVWGLEILFPWRKSQSVLRKDFWLDSFYMFFNFFLFSVFISGFYNAAEFSLSIVGLSMNSVALFSVSSWSIPMQLFIFFILQDFFQWFTHTMLHRIPVLWNFHKVHHSVKEMGFAAHMRYHWMENILYKPLKTLAIMLIGGFEPEQAYIIHFITIVIGHLNHSNIKLTYGPLKYILNNPVMHLYHHAYTLPKGKAGVNYGISLSIWDYIFKTNYIPNQDGEIELGFKGDENFPKDFIGQSLYGFAKKD
ncbi:MAG: sterol desaturase/sphingolipid hydroxylase (fatty acid hydroxylase superfamily) [Vicingaceae bacterium]|jgi:sterol desaturase/sphingolipid hydroxylase (fatty acid hydroxylase superfamily)